MQEQFILSLQKFGTNMAINVRLAVTLTPVGEPWVSVRTRDYAEYSRLLKTTKFDIEFNSNSPTEILEIEHACKANNDPLTAVQIDSIEFFGIQDPKFCWAGVYIPKYPEPWYSEQEIKPAAQLSGQTYLGWNGVYRLSFGIPVFTWIHQIQNLGWIYQ